MMVKVRQDAWSHEDDLLLAETVLRHIREGSTQLKAFDEVGDILNRTSAACGFRWNAEVRKKYESAIDLAKRQRKELKRRQEQEKKEQVVSIHQQEEQRENTRSIEEPVREQPNLRLYEDLAQNENVSNRTLEIPEIIEALEEWAYKLERHEGHGKAYDELVQENEMLEKQVEQLEDQLKKMEESLAIMKSDYETFVQIMERARHMTTGLSTPEEPKKKSSEIKISPESSLQRFIEQSNGF